jgi:hypothetical protein
MTGWFTSTQVNSITSASQNPISVSAWNCSEMIDAGSQQLAPMTVSMIKIENGVAYAI